MADKPETTASALMEDLLRFLPGPQSLVVRYGATAAMVLATFALRLIIRDAAGPYEFMLFVPAIVASALLFDRGSGFFALGLSTVLDATLFPWNQDPQVHVGAIAVFLIVGSGLVLMSEGLHRALERANKAEREAQLLLSEMSHRVKNKFAMVVSMIALQARQSPPETRAALEAIDSRVRVIAKVHDYLQHSRHEGLVNMRGVPAWPLPISRGGTVQPSAGEVICQRGSNRSATGSRPIHWPHRQ